MRAGRSAKTPADPDIFERRRLEVEKYDAIENRLVADLHRIRPLIAKGAVVLDPLTQEPLIDHSVNLAVVDRIIRISNRRAMVLGLDYPRRREQLVITEEVIHEETRRLIAEAERLEAEDRQESGEGHE